MAVPRIGIRILEPRNRDDVNAFVVFLAFRRTGFVTGGASRPHDIPRTLGILRGKDHRRNIGFRGGRTPAAVNGPIKSPRQRPIPPRRRRASRPRGDDRRDPQQVVTLVVQHPRIGTTLEVANVGDTLRPPSGNATGAQQNAAGRQQRTAVRYQGGGHGQGPIVANVVQSADSSASGMTYKERVFMRMYVAENSSCVITVCWTSVEYTGSVPSDLRLTAMSPVAGSTLLASFQSFNCQAPLLVPAGHASKLF